ncbi:MAG: thioredoxin domain-containing protein [Saprospiraceae bacterium]|nr:thioredoxin domain-containing protein [Saprospiraceae bacterium]
MLRYITILTLVVTFHSCKSSQSNNSQDDHDYTNNLVNESSPYLLQHAHNPVDWHPWNEETLAKAKAEDKMMIISIGYAACHWCHVMEHESFEDTTIARIMNENFIPVKVDREERPDVDDVYMTACQLITGRGGWPLNAFAMPDGRPVWAGTYFPKDQWTDILNQFTKIYKDDKAKLEDSAQKITQGIASRDAIQINTGEQNYDLQAYSKSTNNLINKIDWDKGGRKGAPKFPMPNNFDLLLKYHAMTGDKRALEGIVLTLDEMASGGIYDQLGGGFSRYSVDEEWLAPHFEKMLYDNGQLINLYSNTYKVTKNPVYKRIVEETVAFAERELLDDAGAYYSSLDADSEGEEGKFYVWSQTEVDSLITDPNHAKIFSEYYTIKSGGNWENTNILYVTDDAEKILHKNKINHAQLDGILQRYHPILMAHRDTRVRPGTDDKVLTSWNGLMIDGLVEAHKAFGDQAYLDKAKRAMKFIQDKQVKKDGSLYRNYKDGKSAINAFLDDYATVIKAATNLYQVTLDESYLQFARQLTEYTTQHFVDPENQMFHYTSNQDADLVARKKELADNVIPGSNSMMARNLYAIGLYFDNKEYKAQARQMLNNILPQIEATKSTDYYSNWLQLHGDLINPTYEVAIVGPDAVAKAKELNTNYLSNAIILGGTDEGTLALLKDKLQDGETMIYVCQNKVCKFPVTEVSKALELMK